MENIRDLYKEAMEHKENLLQDVIELLVLEKKVLKWEDSLERFQEFLTPPEGKYEAWNERYKQALTEMKRGKAV